MLGKSCRSQKCGSCGVGVTSASGMLGLALAAIGAVAVVRFVCKRMKSCNTDRLKRDLADCKESAVAFAQDTCDEICDCMTDCE